MMINSIEEFKNTYVKNTPELRDAFLGVALHFGLIDSASDIGQASGDAVVAYWHNINGDNFRVGCWYAYAGQIKEECRELTLSDLKPSKEESAIKTLEVLGYVYHGAELWEPPVKKPRTRTEYEKVTGSIFDLRNEFERGELYYNFGNEEWITYRDEASLAIGFKEGNIHRKVEKEIDWREEVRSFLKKPSVDGKFSIDKHCITIDCTFSESEFLELCRVALRANGEIE